MRTALALVVAASTALVAQNAGDPSPRTLDEFRSSVQRVLTETGVPGAGIALVRTSGVEWAGGVGLTDRDNKTPVTADTHFRAGSISKTFVAASLVQLYLDDEIDLDTPIADIAPEIQIDNAWDATDPVRVIHLLQHTAGFDDMHFTEMYNVADAADMPLEQVLRRSRSSLTVRWRPGTRMSYSNPGYAVAAHIVEKVTGEKYEDRIANRIFTPVGMPTSSFYLTRDDEARLAKGYRGPSGPAAPYSQIYLRPSGNLHTSSLELGRFVQLLLNWGETGTELVIDPEYLSNMEHPRTTIASDAGLRSGYGSGIFSFAVDGFPMLGHNGGIDGFVSSYGYSTSRDVGYVVLLNSSHSASAMRRIVSLAVAYLKADVEVPPKPTASIADAVLRNYEGYYHDASPRNQAIAFVEWLLSGRSIRVEDDHLRMDPVFGPSMPLIAVSDTMFRVEADPEATRVFTQNADGVMVFAGGMSYAERRPRWRLEIVRWSVLLSAALCLTPLIAIVVWVAGIRRARRGGGFWWLKTFLLLCAIAIVVPLVGVMNVNDRSLGALNLWTGAIFAGSLLLPAAAILSFVFTIDAWRGGARRPLRVYALAVSVAALVVSGYLSVWGMIGFRPWSF